MKQPRNNDSLIIAVDFDGTVVTHEYPMIGRDIGAVPVLKALVNRGHKLILYTMRTSGLLLEAHDWLVNNGVEIWSLNENPTQKSWTDSNKVYANLYIDDAALGIPLISNGIERPYVDWKKVEQMLVDRGIIS